MIIKLEIPDEVVLILKDRGMSQMDIPIVFETYLSIVFNNYDESFNNEFEDWLDSLNTTEVNDIKNGKWL
jgi:hypothetical protein